MSCDGMQAFNPACQAAAAASSMVNDAFTRTAAFFADAAVTATNWLWQQINVATSIDLNSPALRREMAITGAIAGVVCVGLFVIQLITAALRREPGAISRAVKGLFISALGTGFALASTRLLLGAVDALSEGVVHHAIGTNMQGIGAKLALANVTSMSNPAITLALSLAVLCSAVIVWFAMMIRKMLLIISAVMAPIAFAGATAELTRSWVRKWIEFVCAMAVSKLVLVLILSTGVAVIEGAGLAGSQPTQVGTQLAIGVLILLLGGLSPWLAMRMCTFVGDAMYAAHSTAGHAATGARTAIAAPQKAAMLYSQGRALSASSAGSRPRTVSARAPQGVSSTRPPDCPGFGSGTASGGGSEPIGGSVAGALRSDAESPAAAAASPAALPRPSTLPSDPGPGAEPVGPDAGAGGLSQTPRAGSRFVSRDPVPGATPPKVPQARAVAKSGPLNPSR
ncbi:hypothetical protein ACFQU3_19915 [Terrabacter sp. GCM10028922]|uniref:hypothetical protein n=1 Tax=Terrabacter sp. GCM10028922 TaxID=3273428 RepID=UPI0036094F57